MVGYSSGGFKMDLTLELVVLTCLDVSIEPSSWYTRIRHIQSDDERISLQGHVFVLLFSVSDAVSVTLSLKWKRGTIGFRGWEDSEHGLSLGCSESKSSR